MSFKQNFGFPDKFHEVLRAREGTTHKHEFQACREAAHRGCLVFFLRSSKQCEITNLERQLGVHDLVRATGDDEKS